MRLSKEEFVEAVNGLQKMDEQTLKVTEALRVNESIFDEWFNLCYTLLDKCCDFQEEDYNFYGGSPLDFYLFNYRSYRPNDDGSQTWFDSPEELYDYIVSLHPAG